MKALVYMSTVLILLCILPVGCNSIATIGKAKQVGTVHDWSRTDKYVPPDFESFFPDDPEFGRKLDELFPSLEESSLADHEILRIVRGGLRRTNKHRTLILRAIGNRYIWGKTPQNADAIGIMYHAADPDGDDNIRHYAVYFGLSVIGPKKPSNVLRTLVFICMKGYDVDRITWGCQDQLEELRSYLRPYLESRDYSVRQRALELDNKWKSRTT